MNKKTVLLIVLVLIAATAMMVVAGEADGRGGRHPTLTSIVPTLTSAIPASTNTPGPTPTPHTVHLPLVVNGQQGTATSTIIPLPTLTACMPTLTPAAP